MQLISISFYFLIIEVDSDSAKDWRGKLIMVVGKMNSCLEPKTGSDATRCWINFVFGWIYLLKFIKYEFEFAEIERTCFYCRVAMERF